MTGMKGRAIVVARLLGLTSVASQDVVGADPFEMLVHGILGGAWIVFRYCFGNHLVLFGNGDIVFRFIEQLEAMEPQHFFKR